jgi:hypothetical protein
MIFLDEKTNSDDDQILEAKEEVQIDNNDSFDDKDADSYSLLHDFFEIRINQYVIILQRIMRRVSVCVESRFLNRDDVIFLDLRIFETCDYH